MEKANKKNLWETLDIRQFKNSNIMVFSTAIFAVMMLLIGTTTILSNMSLKSTFLWVSPISQEVQKNSLTPPRNSTSRKRIAWLRTHLLEFKIFKSTNISQQFDQRVVKFLDDNKCEVRFFMTWFSPLEFFGKRELIVVESIFKAHPKGCLIIVSRSMDSIQRDNILKPLLNRGYMILAATPDFSLLLENTPAKTWFEEMKSCKRDPGRIPLLQNLSNLARFAILYKYGGIYLDTDFIVTRSFKGLTNSIGAQTVDGDQKNWTRLNNAVLVFDKSHQLLHHFMEDFALTFDGNRWGYNGPYLVTRVVQRVQRTIGNNFTVLPPTAFYPFNWIDIKQLFKTPKSNNDFIILENELVKLNKESYGLHLWNKITRKFQIEKGSVIEKLVSDHCIVCRGTQR